MNDQASEAAGITTTRTVPLDKPLVRTGGETIDAVQLRKPGSGELVIGDDHGRHAHPV